MKDTSARWVDEDCQDGLHEYCMGDYCECECHDATNAERSEDSSEDEE